MKTPIRTLFFLTALLAGLAGPATAQTFTTLHSFAVSGGYSPFAELVLSGNTLYGTANSGGSGHGGMVFSLNTDGSGLTDLYNFTILGDGYTPYAGLVLSSNTLYGTTTEYGGCSVCFGTVFALNTDGSGFTTLYDFTGGSDGARPVSTLILSGNTLYGTTADAESSRWGTVFAVNTDGSGFTTLYGFTAPDAVAGTNSDGAYPYGGLALSGNTLYGTAEVGGSGGSGTVFSINTDGTGFRTLHNFSADSGPLYTNSDGAYPYAGLVVSGSSLYGAAVDGGSFGSGTVFSINTDGSGFTTLYHFTASDFRAGTNSDGAGPGAGLILSGNTLFGTTGGGGRSGRGTVFSITTDGTGFTALHHFGVMKGNSSGIQTNSDGSGANRLILAGNTLYGTAAWGGSSGFGTAFSLSLGTVSPPRLTANPSGPNLVLAWPINATGFSLQSTTTLGSAAVWTTNLPAPVIVNDQNTVTNPISGAQQFFRLSQ